MNNRARIGGRIRLSDLEMRNGKRPRIVELTILGPYKFFFRQAVVRIMLNWL